MIQRSLLVSFVILLVVGAAPAQRTITNADLERYRQARLKAAQEYRENHERLGLPSPEEIERRRDESVRESIELASRLREDRLEAKRLEIERMREVNRANQHNYLVQFATDPYYYGSSGVFLSGGGFFGAPHGRPTRFDRRHITRQQGYVGGGQYWPTGPRTVSRPIVRVRPAGATIRRQR